MNLLQVVYTFWVLYFRFCNAKEFAPKVTRTESINGFNIQPFDDSTTLIKSENAKLSVTFDNGVTWRAAKDVVDKIGYAQIDIHNSHDRAFVHVLGKPKLYVTNDQGKSWNAITIDIPGAEEDNTFCHTVVTHPNSKAYILAHCNVCRAPDHQIPYNGNEEPDGNDDGQRQCSELTYVSHNGGKNFDEIKPPTEYNDRPVFLSCKFGSSSSTSKFMDNDATIFCSSTMREIDLDKHEIIKTTSEFFFTTDFGKTNKMIEEFSETAIENFEVLESFIVVYTQADKFNTDSPKTLWVSTDGLNFNEAYIPTQLRYSVAGVIFQDSIGRIILPIITERTEDKGRASEVLVSDSSGLKFSPFQWTTEDLNGFTVFSSSKQLKGTMLGEFYVSTRRSWRKKQSSKSKSKITFDNGYSWSNLKVVDPEHKDLFSCDIDDVENCSLHTLFSWDTLDSGRDTTHAATAGILMTVGTVNDGSKLDWANAMTFISSDGGLTWQMAFDFPTMYAFGDLGNIIIAFPFNPDEDEDPESEFYFSLDHGKTWTEYQLEKSLAPIEILSTTPDGSGVNFIVNGFRLDRTAESTTNFLYAIDFSDAFNGKSCEAEDYETWYLAGGECVAGAKYSYRRRKQDSKCLVRKLFEDLQMKEEICDECTEKDYECSFEFVRNADGECVPDYQLLSISDSCSNSKKDTISLTPMQLLKASQCKKELSISPVDVSCTGLAGNDNGKDKILVVENQFDSNIVFYQYFDTVQEESIVIGTARDGVYISHDSGETVRKFDTDDDIVEVVFNPYFNTSAYFFGASGTLYVTNDRGNSFYITELPEARQLGFPLEFHAKDENTFIYYGGKNCDSMFSPECHAVAYITNDGGESFTEMLDNAIHCEFAGSLFTHPVSEDLVICQVKERQSQKRTLVSSKDFFENDKTTLFDSIIGYMSTGEFIVVATPYGNRELRAYVTVDGAEFAEANFPKDAVAEAQQSFTVLGSQTGSVFIHLSSNDERNAEFGVLMKSNSNGTSFVTLENAVNRNQYGMVDFEKVQGLEGIILINVVDNYETILVGSERKKLKSKITFNDGSDWSYIQPPSKDSEGKSYTCGKGSLEKCSLHLHGYSEREDLRDTYSSGSALGMLIGVGNVGEYLLPQEECSTFFSSDGGDNWNEVRKGAYQWEYGDHGSVLVLVSSGAATDTLTYSVDSGKTWADFRFTEEKIVVQDIVTVPRDSALRFMLIGESTSIRGGSTKTFTIDFTKTFDRQCIFDMSEPTHDDFDYFPLGESSPECLFGHETKYLKKITDNCFVGNVPLSDFYQITKNCSCARKDYECDYNYFKAKDGTCKLVNGLSPAEPSEICEKVPDLIEYFEPTGYRKIPLSTCEGGLRLDVASDPSPCPGKEEEFNRKYGVGGRSFILIFIVPFLIFTATAWFVYERGIRRNGGFARFGEIRLGDDDLIENNGTDKMVNSIVRSGLYAVSGFFAGYQLAKRAMGNAVLKLGERFGRRRGPSYSTLLHDQFLDEADDLLTGHDEDANDLGSFLENEGNFEIEEDEVPPPMQTQPYFDDAPPVEENVETSQEGNNRSGQEEDFTD